MSVEDVMQIMGNDAPIRYQAHPRDTHVLSLDVADRCVYTPAFTNPYYLDPAIYCYFDANDILLAAHCIE